MLKRILIAAGVLLGALVLVVAVLAYATFAGRKPIADGLDIRGIHIVQDGITSLAIVPVGAGRVALVDAGNDPAGEAVLAELRRQALGPEAVTAVLLTHGHADHLGAIARFPGAEVLALASEVDVVEGRVGTHGPLTRLFPVTPTGVVVSRPLQDGEIVSLGDVDARVYAVPGHTPGSAAYLINGVLFVGDSADVDSRDQVIGAPWPFSDSQVQNRASLVQLGERLRSAGLAVEAIVPAHSGALRVGLEPLLAFAREP
ncbi:MAG: MBL fold metallo-hydrolase [Vicinamibacterales bacterium]